MTVTDTPLDFPQVSPDDTARTRRTDPPQSHVAADVSQQGIHALRNNLLVLVRENPFIIGTELNDLYRDTYRSRGWKRVAPESPRKRAAEMAVDGYLLTVGVRDGGQQYVIAETGWKVIA
jgi:hypothetical protein